MHQDATDDLDGRIIQELEHDGRRSFRDIARSLRVSEATVRAHYRRLRDSGRLKIVAFSDPAAMRKNRLALLFLCVEPQQHDDVVTLLISRPEVSYVSTTLGTFDIFVQVLVESDNVLWEFLQTVVRPLDGVSSSQCVLEVSVHKLWFESPTLG